MENENKIFFGKYRLIADQSQALQEASGSIRIYKAAEIESGREVLVEVVPASSLKTSVREQLDAEALAAKKISHVNIPALCDFGVVDDHLIYVTEFVDGTTANAWVAQHGPMPTAAVLRIALQVVAALGAAAFHKIVHHALNPGNLLLARGQTADGEWPLVKVLHFVGLAPAFGTSDTETVRFDSSANFASPEQLRGSKVDFRSEIYSLGCTMWFLLTGAAPLIAPGGPVAVQSTDSGLAVDKLTGIPKGLRRLLAQMLSMDPEARPQDPLALYKELEDLLSRVEPRTAITQKFGIPVSSRPQVFAPSLARRIPAKALALAAVLLTLATLAALVGPARLRSWPAHRAASPSEIGVPIGVPDASVAPAPMNAPIDNSGNAVATNQPIAVEATASADLASANQVKFAEPKRSDNQTDSESQARAVVAAENSPRPTEQTPPAEGPTASPNDQSPRVTANDESREVRRALPAPENEESANKSAETAPQETNSGAQTNGSHDSHPLPASSSRAGLRTKTHARSKVARSTSRIEDGVRVERGELIAEDELPPMPRGRVRARVVGMAPDGGLLVELPSSGEVVVVPANRKR